MTSTVVDVTVFLLLIGGAVGTIAAGTGGHPPASGTGAAETAGVLATSTATVTYPVAVGTASATGVAGARRRAASNRTTHGTVAALVADAAVTNATVRGRTLSPAAEGYRRSVADAVANASGPTAERTEVRAVWEPYPDAPIGGSVAVGPTPPADADVHAATLDVGSGVERDGGRLRSVASKSGYRGVADAVAGAIVERFFPPETTRLALRGDYPADALARARYRRAERALGVEGATDDGSVAGVARRNRRLRTALADRLWPDLRRRYDSPRAAAAATDLDRVRLTVRTWSP